MSDRKRSWARSWMAAVALGALLLAIVVPSALADPEQKVFRADFDSEPASIPAGSTATVSLTISNDAPNQQFGSSDVTAPAGHSIIQVVSAPTGSTATIASPTLLELRDLSLQPGQEATFEFEVKTPCDADVYTWSLDGKQANNHTSEPGNDFQLAPPPGSDLTATVTGQCQLGFGFTRQPADAEKAPTVITSAPRDPAGAPVQVEVRSADGGEGVPLPGIPVLLSVDADPCGKTPLILDGETATTDASGQADFPNLSLNQSCFGYTLRATDTSGALTFGVSDPFNIFDDIGNCTAGQSCTASVPGTGSITSAPGTAGHTLIAISAESVIDCPGYTEASGTMLTFSTTTGGMNEVTILLDRSTLDPKRGAGTFRVCYASDTISWINRDGVLIGPGTPSTLPDCTRTNPVAPCQLPTKTSKTFVTVKFLSPSIATRGRT